MTLNKELSSLNSDGVFLVFDLTDPTSQKLSARIEYYYNTEQEIFTYREFVLCTFAHDSYGTNNMILVLELDDIPVTFEEDGTVSYQTASLTKDGTNEKNAFMDYIIFNGTGSLSVLGSENSNSAFWREYRLINSKYNIVGSFSLPWWSKHYEFESTQNNIPQTLYSLITKTFEGKELWDTATMKNLDLEFAFNVMNEFYETKHEEKKWTSYDNFKAAGYSAIKSWVEEKKASDMPNELPVLADVKKEKIAPNPEAGFLGNIFSLSHLAEENYDNSNFNLFFGAYNKDTDGDFFNFLVKKYLNTCGITDDNWIKNFTYSYTFGKDEKGETIFKRFLIPVTNEDTTSFKARYDEALKKAE